MKIIIEAAPEEIAALVLELQGRLNASQVKVSLNQHRTECPFEKALRREKEKSARTGTPSS